MLARQLLLERAPLPVPRALERIGGHQTRLLRRVRLELDDEAERLAEFLA